MLKGLGVQTVADMKRKGTRAQLMTYSRATDEKARSADVIFVAHP